jgi:proline iminopeptidase
MMPDFTSNLLQIRINECMLSVRVCTMNAGNPPVLVVQAGPGLPLLHEVRKFQQRLGLERRFTVYYWDQRGCGPARTRDARSVSFSQQVDDLRALVCWIKTRSGQPVTLFGVSLGGTMSLLAANSPTDAVASVIAISPDIETAESDSSVASFLAEQLQVPNRRTLESRVTRLGSPPYIEPERFQLRARILSDLGVIERKKRFAGIATEMLSRLVMTYGIAGTVRALRNMTTIQRRLLPELASLNLSGQLSRLDVPVDFLIGECDPLVPASLRRRLSELSNTSGISVTIAPRAGHMVHFDRPDIVRLIFNAKRTLA